MIIGTIASIAIHYNFLIGIIAYFIMQIIHIYAFSGILHYNPKFLFNTAVKRLKKTVITSTLGFAIVMPMLYFIMIVPAWGVYSLYILPYVFVLVFMTLITYWHLGYLKDL